MTPNSNFLPYGRQSINEDDISAVVAVLRSNWLTTGPTIEAFEAALAEQTGANHVIACSSGTAALHLAYMACGLTASDSVIVPANTFMATANAARHTGAEILFADVEDSSGLMFARHATEALSHAAGTQPRAIVPVHFAGQCADPEGLKKFADDNGLLIIEDASHALGTSYKCHSGLFRVGECQHSHMTTFSFHPVKTITTGEGGCVTTNDAVLAKKLRELRNHGISSDPNNFQLPSLALNETLDTNPWYHEMVSLGLNYRASDIHCALGLTQLSRLPKFVSQRQILVQHYRALLDDLDLPVRVIRKIPACQAAWHLATVLIDFNAVSKTRAHLMSILKDKGITTQVHYIPVPYQPYYRKRLPHYDFPGARSYYERCLSLPLFPEMTIEDTSWVAENLVDAIRK